MAFAFSRNHLTHMWACVVLLKKKKRFPLFCAHQILTRYPCVGALKLSPDWELFKYSFVNNVDGLDSSIDWLVNLWSRRNQTKSVNQFFRRQVWSKFNLELIIKNVKNSRKKIEILKLSAYLFFVENYILMMPAKLNLRTWLLAFQEVFCIQVFTVG